MHIIYHIKHNSFVWTERHRPWCPIQVVQFTALPRQQHICWMCAITHLYVMFCVLLQSSHFKLLLEHVFRKLGDIHFAWCPIHCWRLILQFLSQQFPSTQLPNVCMLLSVLRHFPFNMCYKNWKTLNLASCSTYAPPILLNNRGTRFVFKQVYCL